MAAKRLRNGLPVTDELLALLAEEAEVGYSPTQVRPWVTGRPSLGEGQSYRVQFRVDPTTYVTLLARAKAEKRGVSEIMRRALEHYLHDQPAPSAATEQAAE